MSRIVEPSIKETAFNCPHCSAYASQQWYELYANELSTESPLPWMVSEADRDMFQGLGNNSPQAAIQASDWFERHKSFQVILENGNGQVLNDRVYNLHFSKCYNCKKMAVWVRDRLVFPNAKSGVVPNKDLPEDIRQDFEEAREIINVSPRGAAALLRLCVQKLCKHCGEKGKNINEDIATLVKKGLHPVIQQSLDVVRVIGNDAVHPGELDLRDDRDTALSLFVLVNDIAEQMISRPKAVAELYAKLPESNRKAIEDRTKRHAQP